MKPNIIHSIVVCLAAFTLPFMVACSSQEESLPENVEEAVLCLNIEPIGRTRAGTTAELPDNEMMHSVRVVVLDKDMKIEHNKHYELEDAQDRKFITLKVTPDEKKKIYLFANEESVSEVEGVTIPGGGRTLTGFFKSHPEGTSGFETAVNDLYFARDYSDGKAIPMSSVYEIDFKEGREDYQFYLVRAATKFTVNFYNWRGEEVTVDNFSIESHADKNFLMAHVNSYPDTQNPETNQKYPTWIDWLQAVSDTSNKDSDAATNRLGWLTDYGLPEQSTAKVYTHGKVTVGEPTVVIDNPDNSKPGVASVVPVFYLPESKNLKAGTTEQEYTLKIKIAERDEPFVCKLDKLKALFRNTHVVVNITMYKNLEMVVDVIPFTSIDLNPDYGLDKEDFTGYVVGKDKNNNTCWYDGNYYDPETAVPLYLGPKDHPGEFVSINGKDYLLVYADYERTAAKLDHFFEKESRKKYLLDPTGRTGYSFTLNSEHPEWGPDIYYNKLQQRVWLDEGYNEWTEGTKWDENQQTNVEAWFWQAGTTWYRTLNEWDRLNWNQARYWDWPRVYPKYWFDVLGNRYPWSEGNTKEKRAAIIKEWIQYLE